MTDIPKSNAMFESQVSEEHKIEGVQKSLTEYPVKLKKELKKHPLNPWLDRESICQHCGRVFPSVGSVRSHLSHCRYRFLNRYYKCEGYLFCIQLNPLQSRRAAIQKLIMDFKDPKLLLGGISILMNLGVVRNYSALQLEDSIDLIEHPNGRLLYSELKKLLSHRELLLLESQVVELNNEKIRLQEEAGIKV